MEKCHVVFFFVVVVLYVALYWSHDQVSTVRQQRNLTLILIVFGDHKQPFQKATASCGLLFIEKHSGIHTLHLEQGGP